MPAACWHLLHLACCLCPAFWPLPISRHHAEPAAPTMRVMAQETGHLSYWFLQMGGPAHAWRGLGCNSLALGHSACGPCPAASLCLGRKEGEARGVGSRHRPAAVQALLAGAPLHCPPPTRQQPSEGLQVTWATKSYALLFTILPPPGPRPSAMPGSRECP